MIVITTPTGDIGHQVVANLLDAGEALRVIARTPSRLSAEVRGRLEVIEGSHGDPAVIDRALEGADALFWLVAPDPAGDDIRAGYVDFARPAAAAIERHGVSHAVVVSAIGRGYGKPAGLLTYAQEMTDVIGATGVAYRELAMPGFLENILRQAESIRDQGVFYGTMPGDLAVPHSATADIAAVAARLLADHGWSGQEVHGVLGPEDLSFNQLVQILGEVIGRPVSYVQIPLAALRAQMLDRGASESMADAMDAMMAAKSDGIDGLLVRTPEFSTPTSVRTWAETVLKPALEA